MRPRTLVTAAALALAVALAGCHESMPGDGEPAPGNGAPTETPPETPPQESPPDPDPAPPPPPEPESTEVGRTLAVGQQSGHRNATHMVLENDAEWQAFWDTHVSPSSPDSPPERPAVDFTRERVAVVVLGDRPDGCYHVRITDVVLDDANDRWVLEVVEYTPAPDMMCTTVITQPYHFITMELEPTTVTYTEHTVAGGPES